MTVPYKPPAPRPTFKPVPRPKGPTYIPNPLVPRPGPGFQPLTWLPKIARGANWLMAGLLAYELWQQYNTDSQSPLDGTYGFAFDPANWFHCCTIAKVDQCQVGWNVRLDGTNSCGGCHDTQVPSGTAGSSVYGQAIVGTGAIGMVSMGPFNTISGELGPCRSRFNIAEQWTRFVDVPAGVPIPFQPWGRALPNPDPEPVTRVRPRPKPRTARKCKPWQKPAWNPWTKQFECHDLKKGREKKLKLDAGLLGKIYGSLTEIDDFFDAMIDSMPKGTCSKRGNPATKAACIWANYDKIDLRDAILNMMIDNLEDRIYAGPSGWGVKGNPHDPDYWVSPKGYDTGGSFRPTDTGLDAPAPLDWLRELVGVRT